MRILSRMIDRFQALLNYDFCPWANRWVHWMKSPLAGIALAAAAALLCGLFVNPFALILLGVLVLVGGLGIVWPWIALRGVRCEADFLRSRCRLGETAIVRLSITNRWPWPLWGLSVRSGFTESDDESAGVSLARVDGWSTIEFEWGFRPHRRGVYPLEPPKLDTGFPFGLLHAQLPIEIRSELIVWPSTVALDSLPDAAEIHAKEERFAERQVGDCGDVLGTRAFREGDSLRRIHWMQSARFGRLIVSERQAPSTCALRLLVDVMEASHRPINGVSTLEQTLSVAASVLESLARSHAFVEVLLAGGRFEVAGSGAALRECLDAMARIPVNGSPAPPDACPFHRRSRSLPTISVTTDLALTRHLEHPHRSAGERYLVMTTLEDEQRRTMVQKGCDCRAWIEIPVQAQLIAILPDRWRRACHAA